MMRGTPAVALALWMSCCSPGAFGAQNAKGKAKEIVRSTGVSRGLCVNLNVTDGKLTAALAESGDFVVHGLAPTRASAEKARQHIQSLNLHGEASVEVADPSRLPYADNLVNLVVADGPGKSKVSMQEVMRVARES